MARGETSCGMASIEATMATACLLCLSKWAVFTICYAPVAAWFGTQLADAGGVALYRPAPSGGAGLTYYGSDGGETDGLTHD